MLNKIPDISKKKSASVHYIIIFGVCDQDFSGMLVIDTDEIVIRGGVKDRAQIF
jgi:hypothetical protein